MFEMLLTSPIAALFVIIALGFMLGRISIKGISLDVSAVIFSALFLGHFGVIVPKSLGELGMTLFIFTIGIQAGPGFFESFRSKGKTLMIITVILILSAAATAVASKYLFDLTTADVVGLLTGALTSTPGLAAAKELAGEGSAISYGIAYPFGVIGVILFVKLLPKVFRINLREMERKMMSDRLQQYPEVNTAVFKIDNANVFNKSLIDLRLRTATGAVISRVMHGNLAEMPMAKTVLHEGDYIKAVGTEEALNAVEMLCGERVNMELPLSEDYEVIDGLVTSKRLVGKTLQELNLLRNFRCTVTRVRRSGIDLIPTPDLTIKWGDKLVMVCHTDNASELLTYIGNEAKKLSDTDFLPIALGIVLGVLVGKINLTIAPGVVFSPGLTGGILITALILSAIGKTGPIMWTMSSSSNSLLRQLGLILFLAEVGTSAGSKLIATIETSGVTLLFVGAAITLIPMVIATILGHYVFKVNMLDLLGVITGGMTSTPGLAAADSMSETGAPSIAYATVYPVAMVFLILAVQLICSL
ncbi:MAG: aspartate:alanine exchanger family transporter [Tannerellaceae bacterium]